MLKLYISVIQQRKFSTENGGSIKVVARYGNSFKIYDE